MPVGVDNNTTYGEGGGIGIPPSSATRAVIRRNWIAGNVNRSVMANGGGIGLSLDATADSIDNNVIYNNLCESPGGDDNYWGEGGGIDTWGGANEVTVTNNLILSNTVRCIGRCYGMAVVGGGMMVNGTSAARPTRVINNTVVGNRAEGLTNGGYGGAFGLQTNCVFANNIMANNSCTAGGCGGAFYWMELAFPPVTVSCGTTRPTTIGAVSPTYILLTSFGIRNSSVPETWCNNTTSAQARRPLTPAPTAAQVCPAKTMTATLAPVMLPGTLALTRSFQTRPLHFRLSSTLPHPRRMLQPVSR